MIKAVPQELGDENPGRFFERLGHVLLKQKDLSHEEQQKRVLALFDDVQTAEFTEEEVETLVNQMSLASFENGRPWLCPLSEAHLKTILKASS